MKCLRIAALIAVMTALPAAGFAQSTAPAKTKQTKAATTTKPAPTTKPATTTMTGVVKSVDETSMVMTRSNAKGPEETFQLNASTTRKGKLVAGDAVSVQYVLDNGQKVAKVVTVTKTAKSGKKSKSGK